MIREFSCHNFRNVNVDKLKLSKINILIGPNNSGKTNFIRALTFYSNMLKHANEGNEGTDFLNAMARNGWAHSKNYEANENESVSFEWHIDYMPDPIVYKFEYMVGQTPEDFKIVLEELNSEKKSDKHDREFNFFRVHKTKSGSGNFSTAIKKGTENKRIPVKLSSTESVICQFDRLLLEKEALYKEKAIRNEISAFIKEIDRSFKSFYFYSAAGFNANNIRRRVDINSVNKYLSYDGSNYANVFNRYRNESLLWKKKYIDIMKLLMRNLTDIDTITQRDMLAVYLVDQGMESELADVSEGTIKALLWCLLFGAPEETHYNLLAIDEPESNMHPAWQKVMADIIIDSEAYDQCVISTHSPDFLDGFTSLFKESGYVTVYAFDQLGNVFTINYEDIAEDLGDWQLGDLYRTQDPALGGWPW